MGTARPSKEPTNGGPANLLPEQLVVAIDTREQQPYHFEPWRLVTLETGDYSIVGLEHEITLERKTKKDAYGSLGKRRARFERELARMKQFPYSAIVIEATLQDFLRPPGYTQMNPVTATRTLVGWSVKYDVGLFFVGTRTHGRAMVRNILEKYLRYRRQGVLGSWLN